MIGDFHIHTRYSFDSLMKPKKIMKIAKKIGLNAIAIIDHNTIRGALETKKFEKDYDIRVIVGAEINTDVGDIVGMNINKNIRCSNWMDLLDEIKSQGAVSVLPHPFRGHKNIHKVGEKVDLIEIWNGRSSLEQNEKAVDLAKEFKKGIIGGSDAHLYSEIGNVKMSNNLNFDGGEIIYKNISTTWEIKSSQILGYIKKSEITSLLHKSIKFIFEK